MTTTKKTARNSKSTAAPGFRAKVNPALLRKGERVEHAPGSTTVRDDDGSLHTFYPIKAAPAATIGTKGRTGRPIDRAAQRRDGWVLRVAAELQSYLTDRVKVDPGLVEEDPAAVAELMVGGLPVRHALDDIVGPFYDTAGLTKWLGVTRQALDARVTRGSLLMCPLADGSRAYPAWQFRRDGTTVPHLPEVIPVLRAGAQSPWTVGIWLRTPLPEFGGEDAVSWLDTGRDAGLVMAAAREDAARWAH